MRYTLTTCTLLAAATLATAPGASAAIALHEYLFTGNLDDTNAAGGTPAMNTNGGVLGSNGYTFSNGNGLSLSNWVPAGTDAHEDYTIEMYVSFDVFGNGSYGRLIDFKDRTEDQGFYLRNINGGHRPVLWNVNHDNPPSGSLNQGQFHHIVLSRDEPGSDDLRMWLDGVQQWNLDDGTNEHAVFSGPDHIIHFFRDDGSEHPGGTVDFIRIYDGGADQFEVSAMFAAVPTYGTAELVVNKRTGIVTIESDNPFEPVSMRGYQLTSAGGTLGSESWLSFDDAGADGGTWSEANPSSTQLAELNLTSAAELGTNDSRSLGQAYIAGINGAEDLVFSYLPEGSATAIALDVRYVTDGQVGDYNGDGQVTAADYTVWADTFGSSTDLRADGNGDGSVTAADYTLWADNFGAGVPGSPVPEPGSLALLALGGVLMGHRRQTRT